ncbi:hypothetical protein H0H92_004995 [Tricholoma furcatifolium]|nr:hypothetical protein H0H92_004995 [Tricholoma furcatifolium]
MSTTSTTSRGNPTTFPEEYQFDGTNYIAFRDRVLIAAELRGADGYLDGSIPRPEQPGGDAKPAASTTAPATATE